MLGNHTFHAAPRRRLLQAILIAALAMPAGSRAANTVTPASEADMKTLRENLADELTRHPPRASEVEKYLRALRPDGTWPDVPYDDKGRSGWRAATHLLRVKTMAVAYSAPMSSDYGSERLLDGMSRAFSHWAQKDYQNPNWWWNRIGVPGYMADILILAGEKLPRAEAIKALNVIVARSGIGMTGQNKVWVAGITLNRAVLLRDPKLVAEARAALVEEVRVTTSEGVQPDYSFHQHGPQQQFGNYGLAFMHDGLHWARIFRGTSYAFTPTQVAVLRNYLLEGLNWVTWKGVLDISACGRQLGPGSPHGKGRSVVGAFRELTELDPNAADACARAITRNQKDAHNDLTGLRGFWRSDMAVYRQHDFYVSVKMSSARVIGTETCNSENLLGKYLGDGVMYVYRSGTEYDDILPAWKWTRLPGLTARNTGQRLVPDTRHRNGEAFVGTLTDGDAGLAAMHYARDGVKARKAWFFADGAVACLGTGIAVDDNDNTAPVTTCVNQCLHRGAVTVRRAEGTPPAPVTADSRLNDIRWLLHDGVGYIFPLPTPGLSVAIGKRSGTWASIDAKQSSSPQSCDVFELTVEHGTPRGDGAYAYVVAPDTTADGLDRDLKTPRIAILRNTPDCQAIACPQTGRLMAVFNKAATLEGVAGTTITVSAPCLLMLSRSRDGHALNACDPTWKLDALTVTVNTDGHAVKKVMKRHADTPANGGAWFGTLALPE